MGVVAAMTMSVARDGRIWTALVLAIGVASCQQPSPTPTGTTSPVGSVTLVVGVRWDPAGTDVSVVDAVLKKVQAIRAGIQAEARFLGDDEVAVVDYADAEALTTRLRVFNNADGEPTQTFLLPVERRAVANVPGPATFVAIPDNRQLILLASSRDGYESSLVRLDLATGEVLGAPTRLDYCGSGFIGYLSGETSIAVVCPETRVAHLLDPHLSEKATVQIAPDATGAWVSGIATGESDIVVCLSSQTGPWRSAFSLVRPDGSAAAPVAISDSLQASPNACSRLDETRVAMGLWGSPQGAYDRLAIINSGQLERQLELSDEVIGPISFIDEKLFAAGGDGSRMLTLDVDGALIEALGGIHATGGLYQ